MEEQLKVKIKVDKVVYYNSDSYFAILGCVIADESYGNADKIQYSKWGNFTVKGTIIDPAVNHIYEMTVEEVNDENYGLQYQIVSINSNFDFTLPEDRRTFIEQVFTSAQVKNLYEILDDPFEALKNKDYESLVKVRGVGTSNVHSLCEKFEKNLSSGELIIKLTEYGLTPHMREMLMEQFAPDVIIKKIKENPYELIYHVNGMGWKKADQIALRGGEKANSAHRVEAFMYYYMKTQAENGFLWIEPSELMGALEENLGEDIATPQLFSDAVHSLDAKKKLWYNNEHTKIGLKHYREVEERLAKELIRIRDSKNTFEYSDVEAKIKAQEEKQGWQFTEQQLAGIKMALENNLLFITGKGGTGKTSIVSGMLAVFDGKYSFAQCALAGKAAARMTEVTGAEGYTIHRLLGIDGHTHKFLHTKELPLSEDIIIIDEVSMPDVDLLLHLFEAVKDGAKVIMLGDVAQLESIGIGNFANDILESPEVPTVKLDKIHRQAAKSAIITESIKVSNGEQLFDKDWVGKETRGELQDLVLDIYSDKSQTLMRVVEHVSELLAQGVNKDDIQVVCPMKVKGEASVYEVNNVVQDMFNPALDNTNEINIAYAKDKIYSIREGDRVINRKNHYDSMCYRDDPSLQIETPIFNGNIGKNIKNIIANNEKNDLMLVDFEGIDTIVCDRDIMKNIELAYAITCHSSQGSEFPYVIVALDFNSYPMLSRQWLYTAITRAKKKVIICAQSSALSFAISKNNVIRKQTHLQECLKEAAAF